MAQEAAVQIDPQQDEQDHLPKPAPKRIPRDKTDPRAKPQPPYAVIIHDDPINGFLYVIQVLRKVFHYPSIKAFRLTLQAHCTGRSIVWSGVLEVAELKADQIRACGPDPRHVKNGAQPLAVTTEPLP